MPSDRMLVLNGKPAEERTTRELIRALNDPGIRTKKGGFLFKSAVEQGNLLLGIIPVLQAGERTHHYDIRLPDRPAQILIGNLSPVGVFTVLFAEKRQDLSEEIKVAYRSAYRRLFSTLLDLGLDPDLCIDRITSDLLIQTGIFTHEISTVRDIDA